LGISPGAPLKATLATAAGILLVVLGNSFGYVRAAIALAMAAAIIYLGFSYFSAAGQAPPEPESEDVADEGLMYVCRMCGLELRVETATSDRAPTHCREKMELVNVPTGSPPLRPV
jgi:hypothetical protein